jgi:tRNA(fMet)-specific endonuclease VapC
MSFLLDTDICSARLRSNPRLHSRFIQYGGQLHASTITLGELFTWAKRANAPSQRLLGVFDLCTEVRIINVDQAVAERFGHIRAALFDAGLPAPEMDLMIAATALEHGLTLVTHNTKDYANVPGLTMVDWLIP